MAERTVATLPDVAADATLEDGRVRIDASDDVALYLRRPRTAPLAESQTAGRLTIAGDGIDIEADAWVKPETQSAVADKLGVSQPTVDRALENIQANIIEHDRLKARRYYEDTPDASYREVA